MCADKVNRVDFDFIMILKCGGKVMCITKMAEFHRHKSGQIEKTSESESVIKNLFSSSQGQKSP